MGKCRKFVVLIDLVEGVNGLLIANTFSSICCLTLFLYLVRRVEDIML